MRYDVVIIGGGLSGIAAGCKLQKRGLRTAAVSFGISLHEPDYDSYRKLGGRLFMGDRVIGGTFNGNHLSSVFTTNFEKTPLEADNFIIATGKFLAGGLVTDIDGVYEGCLGLDVDFAHDRSEWVNAEFFERQAFLSFGVKTDGNAHPSKDGVVIDNLFAIGELVAGRDITSENAIEDIKREAVDIADKI